MQAVVSDNNIIQALAPERDSQSGNILIYPIRLIETALLWEREKLEASVDLICQKTGQKVTLPVSIRLIGDRPEYLSKCYMSIADICFILVLYHKPLLTQKMFIWLKNSTQNIHTCNSEEIHYLHSGLVEISNIHVFPHLNVRR